VVVLAVLGFWYLVSRADAPQAVPGNAATDMSSTAASVSDALMLELATFASPGAILEASGAVEIRLALDLVQGGRVNSVAHERELDSDYRPAVWINVGYAGGGWTLRLNAHQGLEWGATLIEGMTVVFSGEGKTFTGSGAFCQLQLLEAEFDVVEVPEDWPASNAGDPDPAVLYVARSVVGELSCEGLAEIRTGERASLRAVFRLARE